MQITETKGLEEELDDGIWGSPGFRGVERGRTKFQK